VTVHRDKFLIIKPTRCCKFSNLFWKETLHVLDSFSVHHQEFFTVHTAIVYVIQVCWQLAGMIRMIHSSILILLASCQQTYMTYTTAVCTVKNSWWWTEKLSRTCRVSFQNKFENLQHLIGFIVRNTLREFIQYHLSLKSVTLHLDWMPCYRDISYLKLPHFDISHKVYSYSMWWTILETPILSISSSINKYKWLIIASAALDMNFNR